MVKHILKYIFNLISGENIVNSHRNIFMCIAILTTKAQLWRSVHETEEHKVQMPVILP